MLEILFFPFGIPLLLMAPPMAVSTLVAVTFLSRARGR